MTNTQLLRRNARACGYCFLFLFLMLSGQALTAANSLPDKLESITWDYTLKLPDVTDGEHPGLAGAFCGFAGDRLVLAGGANFPEAMPWDGGKKTWWRTAYAINPDDADAECQVYPDFLPEPLAYGVSIQLPEGILCIGGNEASGCSEQVFLITQKEGRLTLDTDWPALPVPLSHATGALSGNWVYIAGGQTGMDPEVAGHHFYRLDLHHIEAGWQALAAWPGKARGYAVSAVQKDGFDDCFYLFGGRDYSAGKPLEILTDGYFYNPRLDTWTALEGEFPVMAGAAVPVGLNYILFLGGVEKLIPGSAAHPGFSNRVRLFPTITPTFHEKEGVPFPVGVQGPFVARGNAFYLGSGELKPGVRTPFILKGEVQAFEKNIGALNVIVIVIYFLLLAFIGYYFSKKQKNTDDYFKGGGRLPWWAVGLSIFGTSLSAITFMAIPAKAFATDWSYLVLNIGIVAVAPLIMFYFIPFFRKLNVTTAYEYLEQRFNSPIRIICSLSFILFQIGKMGIVMFLPAIALHIVTGIDIFLCIGLMGILSIIYTAVGGIEAVVWTDALQVLVLMGGAITIVCISATHITGGFAGIIQEGMADQKFNLGSTHFDIKQSTLWTVIIGSIFTNITTYGTDQTMVQRYMTTKTKKQAQKSVATNALLAISATVLFFVGGTALYVFYKQNPAQMSLTLSEGDAILPWYIYSQLPPGVVGLLISGIFAAAMSTLSSSLNSSATAYVVDIHHQIV